MCCITFQKIKETRLIMDVDLAGVFDDEDFQEEGLNGKVIILNTTTYNV